MLQRIARPAIDGGERPSVPSGILKYHVTEMGRQVANDAMDVHGGKGICLGPSNYLGRGYQVVPVAITVEGANLLTRNLIIFGQGAIRCHPFVLREMTAARNPDRARQLSQQEVDELLAMQASGAALTSIGVERFVEFLERKRKLVGQVQVIAGTEYVELLEKLVGLMYEKVRPYGDRG